MLKNLSDDLRMIADKACLTVLVNEQVVAIQQRLRLTDSKTLGVFLLGGGAVGLMLMPWGTDSNITSKVIGLIIGIPVLLGAVFTIFRQVTDKVVMDNKQLMFCYNLKRTTIPIEPNMRVYTQTNRRRISRSGNIPTAFIELILLVKHNNRELPVLKFQMGSLDTDNAIRLGNELAYIMNARLSQYPLISTMDA